MRASAARLDDLSPVNTIARGYSIARDEQGGILKTVSQAPIGSQVSVTLVDGSLTCDVVGITPFSEDGEE